MAEKEIKQPTPEAINATNMDTMTIALKAKDAMQRQAEAEAELAATKKQLALAEADKKQMIEAVMKSDPTMKIKIAKDDCSIDELRSKLAKAQKLNITNLEQTKLMLELRRKIMEKGEPDPALAQGPRVGKQTIDANFVAEKLQEIIDASYDDPAIFRGNFESAVVDNKNAEKMMKGRITGMK